MKGVLKIHDGTGHSEREWDTEVEESVSLAEQLFDAKISQGRYVAFETTPAGDQVQTQVFNPDAVKILMFPQMSGG